MAKTPDSLTQEEFRGRGYHVIKVESWVLHPHPRRQDFLGIYDYLAFNDAGEMIAIQTTSWSNASSRRKKMLNDISFGWWTRGGRRSILITWECVSKARGLWEKHEEELTIEQWEEAMAKKKERESQLHTDTPLYKMLFPQGH